MWSTITVLFIIGIIQFALIFPKDKRKSSINYALLFILNPVIGGIFFALDEGLGTAFLMICFMSIPAIFIYKDFNERRNSESTEKKYFLQKENSFADFLKEQYPLSLSKWFTHPVIPLFYRIFVIIMIISFFKTLGFERRFDYEAKFQALSIITIFYFSIIITFNKIDFYKFTGSLQAEKDLLNIKTINYVTLQKVMKWALLILWILSLYLLDAYHIITQLLHSEIDSPLIYVFLFSFAAVLFLMLIYPITVFQLYFYRLRQVVFNFRNTILVGIAFAVPLGIFYDGSFPVLLMAFNGILLYNEIRVYKYFIQNQ